jgi:leucyl-tRNA synthetase
MVCKTAYFCENCKWIPEADVEGGTRKGDGLEGGKCKKCGADARAEMTKISKSKLNIVDPDKMMDKFGADCVRLYMLSDNPPDQERLWSDERMQGSWRFLSRIWKTVTENLETIQSASKEVPANIGDAGKELRRKTHESIKKVTDAIEGGFRFNTAISSVMELLNMVRSPKDVEAEVLREAVETMLILIAPIAPHFCEELWESIGNDSSIFSAPWPIADSEAMKVASIEIPVQVNGKIKARILISPDMSKDELERVALDNDSVKAAVEGKEIKKVIAVPGKIVNVAVK